MKQPRVTLYIQRHGTTQLNDADPTKDRIKGWADVPLDDDGMQVAHQAAGFIKKAGIPITHIISSDLARAAQTAHIMGNALGAQVATTPRLRPWNAGQFEGMPYSEIGKTLEKYQEQTPDKPLPGGESYNDFFNRFKSALPELIDMAKQTDNKLLVVAHSRHLLALDAAMKGSSINKAKSFGAPPPGSIVALHVNPSR